MARTWIKISIFLLISVIICCADDTSQQKCHVWGYSAMTPSRRSRFFRTRGDRAKPGSWPWIASLESRTDGTFRHICSATLIGYNTVITAAECFLNSSQPADYRIKLGLNDLHKDNTYTQTNYISAIYIHPKYRPAKPGRNLALVSMNGNVKVTDQVTPIPLNRDLYNDVMDNSDACYVISFGSSDGRLQQIRSKILQQRQCKSGQKNVPYSLTKSFCQVRTDIEEAMKSCDGTVGGAMVCRTKNEQFMSDNCINRQGFLEKHDGKCQKYRQECARDRNKCELKGTCQKVWRMVGLMPYGIDCGRRPGFFIVLRPYLPWMTRTMRRNRRRQRVVQWLRQSQ